MKFLWGVIGLVVVILVILGSRNVLHFRPNLFLILLLLLSLMISASLWIFRKKL